MFEPLKPCAGGFMRAFGAGVFIRDYLAGKGDKYGAPIIDPDVGATQQDIHRAYKEALHLAFAEDAASLDREAAIRRGKPMTQAQAEERKEYYLARIPYRLTSMRYHSFLVYFGMFKRLLWVEPTGRVEVSVVQETMALKPDEEPRAAGQPRIYYRLTDKGRKAPLAQVSNPLRVLYPEFTSEYFRKQRKAKKYIRRK